MAEFQDRILKCSDCGAEFVFTAGEQHFFHDKNFKNEPKRCKACKSKRRLSELRRHQRAAASWCSHRRRAILRWIACGRRRTILNRRPARVTPKISASRHPANL